MQDLIFEYKRALQEARKMYKPFQQQEDAERNKETLSARQLDDKKLISGMISDLEFTIEWLESGRLPGAKRGYDRRASYQRMILKDTRIIDTFSNDLDLDSVAEVYAADLERIEDALSALTKWEKEILFWTRSSYTHTMKLLNY